MTYPISSDGKADMKAYAMLHSVSISEICKINGYNPNEIPPAGKKIIIPFEISETQKKELIFHTVKNGESLEKIAKNYGVSVQEILNANPSIKNPDKIKEGQTIQILIIQEQDDLEDLGDTFTRTTKPEVKPEAKPEVKPEAEPKKTPNEVNPVSEKTSNTYIVKQGDTLSAIAKKHGISLNELLKLNPNYNKNNILKIGAEIVIPTKLTKTQIQDKIKQETKKYGLDESLVMALVEQESNFDPSARSKTGAAGLFQITKIAAQQVNDKKTYNIDKNIEIGLKYLKWCIENTSTDEEALVAYNRGLQAMKNAKKAKIPIDSITDKKNGKGYAENVLELKEKYEKLQKEAENVLELREKNEKLQKRD